jgi:hypothetical protein
MNNRDHRSTECKEMYLYKVGNVKIKSNALRMEMKIIINTVKWFEQGTPEKVVKLLKEFGFKAEIIIEDYDYVFEL